VGKTVPAPLPNVSADPLGGQFPTRSKPVGDGVLHSWLDQLVWLDVLHAILVGSQSQHVVRPDVVQRETIRHIHDAEESS